jgi:preprotein translocase subunit SecD
MPGFSRSHLVPALMLILGSVIAAGGAAAEDEAARKEVTLEFHLVAEGPGEDLIETTIVGKNTKIYLEKKVELSNVDFAGAETTKDASDNLSIAVSLTEAGARKLADLTENNIGRKLAIVVNGEVLAAPTIQSKSRSSVMISGSFSEEEIKHIVEAMNSGQ